MLDTIRDAVNERYRVAVPVSSLRLLLDELTEHLGQAPDTSGQTREEFSPYVPDESLPPAWLVDVDWTLTTGPGTRSPYDWSKVSEDAPNLPVIRMVQGLAQTGAYIVVVSGRDAVCARSTQAWLEENMVPVHALFLRKRGDTRDEAVVKSELLDLIATGWQVLGVVDDRDKVVDMWRSRGLMCAQVAPGKF
jgi:hypothetical protein